MTTLRFYGGVDEIGGNKILLEDRNTRVWLDFGLSYGKRGKFYGDFMGPRSKGGIRDLLRLGLVPRLDGIYRDDLDVRTVPDCIKACFDRLDRGSRQREVVSHDIDVTLLAAEVDLHVYFEERGACRIELEIGSISEPWAIFEFYFEEFAERLAV